MIESEDEQVSTPETYSVTTIRRSERRALLTVGGSVDVHRLVAPMIRDADREHFYVLLLSTKNHVLGLELVSVGSLSASIVHPREVFKPAIAASAAAIVVAHNHPSGDPSPSAEDEEFTRRLARAGELLGIRVLDHLIVGAEGYCSLREAGVL